MKRWGLFAFSGLVTIAAASASSQASVVTYTTESSFLVAAPTATTETFDSFASDKPIGGPSMTIGGVTYTSSLSNSVWIPGIHFDIIPDASGVNDFGSNTIDENDLSFGAGAATTAIGFYLRTPSNANFQITINTAAGETLVQSLAFSHGQSPYRGYVAPEGITSVRIGYPVGATSFANFSFDNVSSAPVPEPTIAASAVLGLGMLARRRRVR